jgi:hypothetical protein
MSIRALVVTACCVLLLPLGAAAQSVGGGVKGGVTLADVPNSLDAFDEPGASTSLRVGFAAGGFLSIRFGGGFSIQPEVLFTQAASPRAPAREAHGARRAPSRTHPWRQRYQGLHDAVSPGESIPGRPGAWLVPPAASAGPTTKVGDPLGGLVAQPE